MKNTKIRVCSLLLGCLLLAGCTRAPGFTPRPVTQIRITGVCAQRSVQRQYRDSEKMENILNYLRTLDFTGYTSLNPAMLPGDDVTILLVFSTGDTREYRVHANRYLCRPDGKWEKVDSGKAGRLTEILDACRSD